MNIVRHIVIVIFLLSAVNVSAQTEAELKKRKANTEKELADITRQLNTNKAAKQNATAHVNLLNRRIDQRKKLIRDTDIQISLTEKEISHKKTNIEEIQTQLAKLKENYSELLVNVYMNRKKSNWLMYLFASEDFGQAYRRLKYMQSYTDAVTTKAEKIKKTTEQLSEEVLLLDSKKDELNSYQSEKKNEVAKLAIDESDAQKALQGLKKEETALRKQMQQKRATLSKLNAEIEKLLTKEVKKTKTSGYTKAPADVKLSGEFAANRGRLPWPVKQGKITGLFGRHFHPIFKGVELPPNNGIDISTNAGEVVLSVFNGKVTSVFAVPGMNACVMIQHGEYYTVYARLSNTSVKVGETVKTGAAIGKVAAGSDGSALHFELWKGTTKLNPQLWLLKK